ncbi:MAG: ExeA family protein, partial [Candidatus Eiseniibacteriota bacterium]
MTNDSPFAPVLSRQSYLETLGAAEALRRLDDGLGAREPFVLITGEPGTGKSALVNQAIARWGSRVTAACLAFPVATGPELMEAVLQRLGSAPPDGASRARLFACLEAALAEIAGRGQVAVIVMDDAHHLSRELLEELRLLVNAAQQARRSLEVMLVGLPALEATLEDPALAALRQRVSVRAKLEPLSPGETRRYLRHRVAATGDDRSNLFPRKTCAEIATLARGVPREINALAGEALRLARDAGHPTVEPAHVRSAVAALSGALPKDEANDSAEAGAEAPATGVAAKPPVAAKAPPPATVPAPASAVPPVAAAVPPRVARPSPAASAPRPETAQAPAHTPPASHDAREWVARFVGDKGPLQIGSQAAARSTWTPASLDAESFTSAEQSDRSPALFER